MTQELKLNENGLIPAIAQHHETGQVLMMAYVSPDSLKHTMEGEDVWFYSRSRQALWHKGEESGNYLRVKSTWVDCDGDTLLFKVDPVGPACHTGEISCFFTELEASPTYADADPGVGVLEELFAVIKDRQANPTEESYTAKLIASGVGKVAQKVVEEAGETAIAAAAGKMDELPGEVADLLYHTLTLLAATGTSPKEVWDILAKRRQGIGLH
jgi:phosphoribosyl-ATP pyrophosphohydrolase/phosphoribosyl-AMP cyclohydrolase